MPEPPLSRAGGANLQVFGEIEDVEVELGWRTEIRQQVRKPNRRDGPAVISNNHYAWCQQVKGVQGARIVKDRPTHAAVSGKIQWS